MISLLLGLGGGLIGFLLSVLGAGGSILLLPLLVSGAALPTQEAVPLSLIVVMLLALANLGPYLRRGQFAPKPALLLGLPALGGSWIGGSWVKAGLIPEAVQLSVFAAAALLAKTLPIASGEPWQNPQQIPDVLIEAAQLRGIPLQTEQWGALNELERFALCKLARPGHDHHNLEAAFSEVPG